MGRDVSPTRVVAARGVPRRKAGGGGWEVFVDGRWIREEQGMKFQQLAPESLPAAAASSPVKRRTVAPRGLEAYELCAPPPQGKGMYWADAAELMGTSSSNVRALVEQHMKREGIAGEVPGRMPQEVRNARAAAGRMLGLGRVVMQADADEPPTTSAAEELEPPSVVVQAGSGPVDDPTVVQPEALPPVPTGPGALASAIASPVADDGRRCAVCGCTNEYACRSGCWWVEDPTGLGRDLCSRCIPVDGEEATLLGPGPDWSVALEMLRTLEVEQQRLEQEIALVDAEVVALARRRQSLQAVLDSLAPAREAYEQLVATDQEIAA